MKKVSAYVLLAKAKLGDPHMSDRELGERLGGYSTGAMSDARYEKMSDPIAVKIAEVLRIPPGELLWAARTARERDPIVKRHLESWARDVGKLLAAVPANAVKVLAGLSVALGFEPIDLAKSRGRLAWLGGVNIAPAAGAIFTCACSPPTWPSAAPARVPRRLRARCAPPPAPGADRCCWPARLHPMPSRAAGA